MWREFPKHGVGLIITAFISFGVYCNIRFVIADNFV